MQILAMCCVTRCRRSHWEAQRTRSDRSIGLVHAELATLFFFSSRRRHTRCSRDWSSDVCSSDLVLNGNQIVFQFKTAAVPYFYYIADQTPIVPQHIWSTIANPVTYKDPHPVGSEIGRASCRERV